MYSSAICISLSEESYLNGSHTCPGIIYCYKDTYVMSVLRDFKFPAVVTVVKTPKILFINVKDIKSQSKES